MVRMKVKVVGIDQYSHNPVVIITDHDEKGFIPILIGGAEAAAIALELEGKKPPRPITHDLLKNVLDAFGAQLKRVVICDLKEQTYFARIYLDTKDGELDIDARPSDAIALALRTQAPIYISEDVAEKALIASTDEEPLEDKDMEDFREFLKDLNPDDFRMNFKGKTDK